MVRLLADDTGNRAFLGRTGTIEYYDYDCGCGQTFPADPMIGVRFPDGQLDEFWREELRIKRR